MLDSVVLVSAIHQCESTTSMYVVKDREVWQAAVRGVAKSQTGLSDDGTAAVYVFSPS